MLSATGERMSSGRALGAVPQTSAPGARGAPRHSRSRAPCAAPDSRRRSPPSGTYAACSSSPSPSSSAAGISLPESRVEGAAAAAGARAGVGGAGEPRRCRPQGSGCRGAAAGRAAGGSRCAAARSRRQGRRQRKPPGRAGPSAPAARRGRPCRRLAEQRARPASGGLAGGHSRTFLFRWILPAASDSATAEPVAGDGEPGAPPLLPPAPAAPPRPAPGAPAPLHRPGACPSRARNWGSPRTPNRGPHSPPFPNPWAPRLQTRLPRFPDLPPLLSMPSPARHRHRRRRVSTWGLKFSGFAKKRWAGWALCGRASREGTGRGGRRRSKQLP